MSEVIGTEQVLALLDKVVQAKGADYVYPGTSADKCYNFEPQGAPSCIVGHVLAELGVTRQQAAEFGVDGSAGVHDTVHALAGGGWQYMFSVGAMNALHKAQGVQDRRDSWGDALDAARRVSRDYIHNERFYNQPYISLVY